MYGVRAKPGEIYFLFLSYNAYSPILPGQILVQVTL